MTREQTLEFIEGHRIVSVMRLPNPDLFEPVALALGEGGVRVLEITMTTPDALRLIEYAATHLSGEFLVGVGSVTDPETVDAAVGAGASFIVSPILRESVMERARALGVAMMPGAMTPTEIQTAWEMGADVVKVFPADVMGMSYFGSVLAPLPHLKLMPTGGVSLTNGGEWLRAGACAVGIGSALVSKAALADRDFDQIRRNAEVAVSHVLGTVAA